MPHGDRRIELAEVYISLSGVQPCNPQPGVTGSSRQLELKFSTVHGKMPWRRRLGKTPWPPVASLAR